MEDILSQNVHMHCHLKSVILEPVYAFWLFSYERFNGILGNQPSNNHSIIQLMRRINRDNTAYMLELPTEFNDDFSDLCALDQRLTGSLLLTTQNQAFQDVNTYDLGLSCTCHVFSSDDVEN